MHFQVIVDSDIFLPLKMKNEISTFYLATKIKIFNSH